jgi:hypothetical protein
VTEDRLGPLRQGGVLLVQLQGVRPAADLLQQRGDAQQGRGVLALRLALEQRRGLRPAALGLQESGLSSDTPLIPPGVKRFENKPATPGAA